MDIQKSLIISLLITLGISLIFLIPFIHTYIYDLSKEAHEGNITPEKVKAKKV
jgi:hypothetical protein